MLDNEDGQELRNKDKNDNKEALKTFLLNMTTPCEKFTSEVICATQEAGDDNESKIFSTSQNNPTMDDVYHDETNSDEFGGEDSAGDMDPAIGFLDIAASRRSILYTQTML